MNKRDQPKGSEMLYNMTDGNLFDGNGVFACSRALCGLFCDVMRCVCVFSVALSLRSPKIATAPAIAFARGICSMCRQSNGFCLGIVTHRTHSAFNRLIYMSAW